MYDFLLTPEARELKIEARRFAREEISADFLREMDKDEVSYPREFVMKLSKHGLLGVRFPKQYGGREMSWVAEVAATEEVGCLGMALGCAYVMPSIVGEALNVFGTEEQKEKYLKPYIEGKSIAAEALTEPRGGSDFFGAMTRAELQGDNFILNGMKRFVVGAEGADFFLVYCKTNFDPNAHKHNRLSLLIVDRGPGIETEYLYGLLGCRGGGTGRLVFRDVMAKRFTTEASWDIVNTAMQIMGGIGYTDVYPIERALRDIRLGMIWTGTSEIMNLMIQHEYFDQVLDPSYDRRKMEGDAMHPDESERCHTDEDMQRMLDNG